MDYAKESLRLHGQWKGKIEVVATVPVSTKDRPVTQVQEVAVNNAVKNGVTSQFFAETGSINRPEPAKMIAKKTKTMICMGVNPPIKRRNLAIIFRKRSINEASSTVFSQKIA